jgi:hypothetical protein
MGRPRNPNDPSVMSSVEHALNDGGRTSIVGIAWRWRYELALALGLAIGGGALALTLGIGWLIAAGATLALGTGGLWAWPPGREFLVMRAWCVITAHRVRTGCMHAWIQSRDGRLPTVLRTTAEPFGERVRLWCPPGVTAADLEAARDVLSAACWARDVQVTRSNRHAHLVTLDVIRRDITGAAGPPAAYPYVSGWDRPAIDRSAESAPKPDDHDTGRSPDRLLDDLSPIP